MRVGTVRWGGGEGWGTSTGDQEAHLREPVAHDSMMCEGLRGAQPIATNQFATLRCGPRVQRREKPVTGSGWFRLACGRTVPRKPSRLMMCCINSVLTAVL